MFSLCFLEVSSWVKVGDYFVGRMRGHFPLDCVFTCAGVDVDDGASNGVSLKHPVIFDVIAVGTECD